MNSWKSTELSACAPPLRMFIIGTGSRFAELSVEYCDKIFVERLLLRVRRGARSRHRHGQNRVGAQPRLGRRAVQLDHVLIERALIARVQSRDRLGDFPVDIGDRLQDAFAEISRLVAVAQFQRFVFAGRRARRHRGPPATPAPT